MLLKIEDAKNFVDETKIYLAEEVILNRIMTWKSRIIRGKLHLNLNIVLVLKTMIWLITEGVSYECNRRDYPCETEGLSKKSLKM